MADHDAVGEAMTCDITLLHDITWRAAKTARLVFRGTQIVQLAPQSVGCGWLVDTATGNRAARCFYAHEGD